MKVDAIKAYNYAFDEYFIGEFDQTNYQQTFHDYMRTECGFSISFYDVGQVFEPTSFKIECEPTFLQFLLRQ